ncbi:MAG: hypothetical protein KAI43_01505 [Candidatus Aureabacteria bacterium]|nr:hypothetical protein [Candidatus Auribacterota bacterium]
MIYINLLPASERGVEEVKEEVIYDITGKRRIDWFSLAPKLLGGILALLLVITLIFIYLPNRKRVGELSKLEDEKKLLEPAFSTYTEKKVENDEYQKKVDEFYRFVDEKVIWSRLFHVLAKHLPNEIRFVNMNITDDKKIFKKKITVIDKKTKKSIDKFINEEQLVHVVTIKGLVSIDAQLKVTSYKKSIERDEYLKQVIREVNIPVITSSSKNLKSFKMKIIFDTLKAQRD